MLLRRTARGIFRRRRTGRVTGGWPCRPKAVGLAVGALFCPSELRCVMTEYRVSFFNNLVNSNGRQCKCLQRTVQVRGVQDAKAATDKAKEEFERLENVPSWRCHAQFIEVDPVSGTATEQSCHPPKSASASSDSGSHKPTPTTRRNSWAIREPLHRMSAAHR